ncbi:MAG: hypothetical protein LBF60_02095 [Treponema sp.]|nr:hypothetical protein [Treponema sp.]
MKKMFFLVSVLALFFITPSVFSQTIYNKNLNEDSFNWATFSDEFNAGDADWQDELEWKVQEKSGKHYFVMTLTFSRQEPSIQTLL